MRWRRNRKKTLCGLVAMAAVAGSAQAQETSPYVKVVTTRECSIVTPARTQMTTRTEPGYTRSTNPVCERSRERPDPHLHRRRLAIGHGGTVPLVADATLRPRDRGGSSTRAT